MALSSGVYTLIGVAVGSATTVGFQLFVARRTERRDTLAARRQVLSEIEDKANALDYLRTTDPHLPLAIAVLMADDAWRRYADLLAHDLSDHAWRAVDRAYRISGKGIEIEEAKAEWPESLRWVRDSLEEAAKAIDTRSWQHRLRARLGAPSDE